MISVLLAVLLIPADARAAICTPGDVGPCVPSDIQEQKRPIMDAVDAALTARDQMDEANQLKFIAVGASDRESQLSQWTAALESERRMKNAANLAIRLSQQVYHLTPPASGDPRAQKPIVPGGDWCTNLPAPWAPEFQISRYRAISGSDNVLHYVSDVRSGRDYGWGDGS